MFKKLKEINKRPEPFQYYTAQELWADEHTSKQMLKYHLDESVDLSSRNLPFIDRSAEWMISCFRVNEKTNIADFGCGPGLYTERLSKQGAKVTGIDFSATSIAYAKEMAATKDLDINYIQMNYLDYVTIDQFDLIIMIMCDFCVLSPVQRKALLEKFRSLLKPDGSVLLDVYTLNSFHRQEESAMYEFNQLNGFWSPDDYYCFVNTFKYDEVLVTLDKYTVIEQNRTRTVYNWLQYFSEESLRNEFEESGFRVKAIYADVSGQPLLPDSAEMAVVASPVKGT